jgi:hypothetical protein
MRAEHGRRPPVGRPTLGPTLAQPTGAYERYKPNSRSCVRGTDRQGQNFEATLIAVREHLERRRRRPVGGEEANHVGSSPLYRRRRSVPPQLVGVGVGKRRWYATIFSFDRPRSRRISTERRGGSLSQAGFPPRSSSPWPLPCRSLVFTRADFPEFIPAAPPMFHVNAGPFMPTRTAFMAYLSSLTGMRRLAVAPSEWLGTCPACKASEPASECGVGDGVGVG